jgi:hypothetical protein
MGSEREFTEVLDQVRRQGCRVAFYINGQAWDPRWPACPTSCAGMMPASVKIPDWEAGFKQNALHRYDGTLYSQYRKAAATGRPRTRFTVWLSVLLHVHGLARWQDTCFIGRSRNT